MLKSRKKFWNRSVWRLDYCNVPHYHIHIFISLVNTPRCGYESVSANAFKVLHHAFKKSMNGIVIASCCGPVYKCWWKICQSVMPWGCSEEHYFVCINELKHEINQLLIFTLFIRRTLFVLSFVVFIDSYMNELCCSISKLCFL